MSSFRMAALVAASLVVGPCLPAHADNQMGYRMLSVQDAASLPHNQGALGLDVDRAQQITDGGMTFDIIRVKQVKRDSAGARAGFRPGDQIIALDGNVFPTLSAFADYIGSVPPGNQILVDYMPAGSGPQKAQRVAVVVGQAGRSGPVEQQRGAEKSTGMSTGSKIAIGAGAVALLGCYEMGCFSHRKNTVAPQQRVQANQSGNYQQQPYNGQSQQQPYAAQPR